MSLMEYLSRMHCEWDTGLALVWCGGFFKVEEEP